MRLRLFLFLLFLTFSTSVRAQDRAAASSTVPTTPVFGVVEAYYRPNQATALGVSWDRVIFAWNYFQPTSPDDFDTSAVPEQYLQSDQAANRQVVGLIKGTPAWASPSGSVGAVPDNIQLPFDDPQNYYGAFILRLVRYYSARGIHDWIIMNEPDVRDGEGVVEFQGDVHDYYNMLKVAYLAAKSVDPQAHIQIAGTTWWTDWVNRRVSYIYRLLGLISTDPHAAENHWYFDGISLHIYFTTASVWEVINANRQILAHYGLTDKQIWLDEFNASPRLDPVSGYNAPFQIDLQQQADFIVQASASALAAGASRLAVYRLYDNHFVPGKDEPWGLIRFDDYLRPAYYAYQQVIKRFSGAQNIQRLKIPQATVITMSFPGSTLYVMWNDSYTAGEFLIHAADLQGDFTALDAEGNTIYTPLVSQIGISLVSIDAPPARKIDMPWEVVGGPVRMIQLSGSPRTIWFQPPGAKSIQMN
jgi:hypothetical protein